MTASSLRLSSQPISSPGGTASANCRLPRLRQLPASPKQSLTTMSVRPASLRPVIRLEPMNPAPPVTNNIAHQPPFLPPFAPGHSHVQRLCPTTRKMPCCRPGAPRTLDRHQMASYPPFGLAAAPRREPETSPPCPLTARNEFKFAYFSRN